MWTRRETNREKAREGENEEIKRDDNDDEEQKEMKQKVKVASIMTGFNETPSLESH